MDRPHVKGLILSSIGGRIDGDFFLGEGNFYFQLFFKVVVEGEGNICFAHIRTNVVFDKIVVKDDCLAVNFTNANDMPDGNTWLEKCTSSKFTIDSDFLKFNDLSDTLKAEGVLQLLVAS